MYFIALQTIIKKRVTIIEKEIVYNLIELDVKIMEIVPKWKNEVLEKIKDIFQKSNLKEIYETMNKNEKYNFDKLFFDYITNKELVLDTIQQMKTHNKPINEFVSSQEFLSISK